MAKSRAKKCKAVNQKDKCIVYEAVHTNATAAKKHSKKIKARGGKIKRTTRKNKIVLNYSFTKK